MSHYSDIQTILNTLEDGDHFGELAVIDVERLDSAEREGKQAPQSDPNKTRKRKASCVAVENTKVIRIECTIAQTLLQPRNDESDPRWRSLREGSDNDSFDSAEMGGYYIKAQINPNQEDIEL